MSVFTETKARLLLEQRRVLISCNEGVLSALVRGDTGLHMVTLDEWGHASVTVRAGDGLCSHALALERLTGGGK